MARPKKEKSVETGFETDAKEFNEFMKSYNWPTVVQMADFIDFGVPYMRDVLEAKRPMNTELRKSMIEYMRTHPKGK